MNVKIAMLVPASEYERLTLDVASSSPMKFLRAAFSLETLLHQLTVTGDIAHQGRDFVRDRRDCFPFYPAGTGPYQVDLKRRVERGIVGAVVRTAGLQALERCLEGRARGQHGGL